MTASLLVRTFSHLAVSCFVHRSRQTKQPEDDMRECLCPKPSHTTVPVSLKRQPHALRPRKIQQFLGSETLGKISLTPGDAAKHWGSQYWVDCIVGVALNEKKSRIAPRLRPDWAPTVQCKHFDCVIPIRITENGRVWITHTHTHITVLLLCSDHCRHEQL